MKQEFLNDKTKIQAMKKVLKQTEQSELYHYDNGVRVNGKNSDMSGDCSGLRGDCTGLEGNCTGLEGNLDDCEITEDERKRGVNIKQLVG